MIVWYSGNNGSGKTTWARAAAKPGDIILDGDGLRNEVWPDEFDLTEPDRWEHNLRVARLAAYLDGQGVNVFVAVIAPYRELRYEIEKICGCKFIYVPGGKSGPDYPYEPPINGE